MPKAEPLPGRAGGLMLVAVAAAFWSIGGLVSRLLEVQDIWTINFWRSLFALLVLVGYVIARERSRTVMAFRDVGWAGVGVGACFATASLTFVMALSLTSVANLLVILATAPLMAALFGRWFLDEAVQPRTWLAMAASLVGVTVMVGASVGETTVRGDLVALIVPIVFAIGTVIIRRNRHVEMMPAMALGPLIGVVVAFTLASGLRVTPGDLGLLALFGGVQLGTGMAIYSVGARLAPAAEVHLISLLETVLGPLWVWLGVGERPTSAALVGGAVVMSALAFNAGLDLRTPRTATG